MQSLRSPKKTPHKPTESTWYNYNAGYTEGFVEDVLKNLNLPSGATVLDPWNGTGTTTSVAFRNDFEVHGYDINPATILIAKARLLGSNVVESLKSLTDDLVEKVSKGTNVKGNNKTEFDALDLWFLPDAVTLIRGLEREVYSLFIDKKCYTPLFHSSSLNHVSSLAALFYVALFRTVRDFVEPEFRSQPMWIKQATSDEKKLKPSKREVLVKFRTNLIALSDYIKAKNIQDGIHDPPKNLNVASAEHLPLGCNTVDAVITSPPYCTRIDYAIATLPELAVLGFKDKESLRGLRDKITGTPTILKETRAIREEWGNECVRFLKTVESHKTRAAKHYYFKFFHQYFASLHKSLTEIDRILKPRAKCVIVVQDSYFKNVHNDLPLITSEMAENIGWELVNKVPFSVKHNFAFSNRHSKRYREASMATEAVLIFEK